MLESSGGGSKSLKNPCQSLVMSGVNVLGVNGLARDSARGDDQFSSGRSRCPPL
jgi:hypothetical protein